MSATATKDGYETIQFEVIDGVAIVTLDRPDSFNAFSDALTTELLDAIRKVERDPAVRVAVLTGSGKAFSSGQDLAELKERYVPGSVPDLGKDLERRYNPIVSRIVSCEKPFIAAVNGVAAGAGCSLALACDLRIASEHASFMEVFINVGLIPDSGSSWFLPRLVGHARAMELCCTGRKVTAEEADRIGLVNRVVPADALRDEAMALARQIAAMPARGVALTKRLLTGTWQRDLDAQLEAEMYAQDTAGRTDDHMEGVTAFLEKRRPEFKGR